LSIDSARPEEGILLHHPANPPPPPPPPRAHLRSWRLIKHEPPAYLKNLRYLEDTQVPCSQGARAYVYLKSPLKKLPIACRQQMHHYSVFFRGPNSISLFGLFPIACRQQMYHFSASFAIRSLSHNTHTHTHPHTHTLTHTHTHTLSLSLSHTHAHTRLLCGIGAYGCGAARYAFDFAALWQAAFLPRNPPPGTSSGASWRAAMHALDVLCLRAEVCMRV
jgi:hypothetical protein